MIFFFKYKTGLCIILFPLFFSKAWAFDYDYEMHFPNFKNENFLDMKSYQFNPILDDQWYETTNGIRINSGSLDLDYFYLIVENKIRKPVFDGLFVNYRLKHEAFYGVKPYRQQIEVQYRLFDSVYFSFIGFPAYDKRRIEIGSAVTIGNEPWKYFRVSQLEQGSYYNEKNFESDRFNIKPIEDEIEGAYELDKLRFRFHILWDRPLEQEFPEKQLTFKHHGEDANLRIEYIVKDKERFGFDYRGSDFFKFRMSTSTDNPENRNQTIQYLSSDFYWIQPIMTKHLLTVGTRYDRFLNLFRNSLKNDESHDYLFDTWQIYGTWLQPWNPSLNMDYGIYVGDTIEKRDYVFDTDSNSIEHQIESKLRISWVLRDSEDETHYYLTTTWNLDNLFADFWDGGHMAFQTRF